MSDLGPERDGDLAASISTRLLLPELPAPGSVSGRAAEYGLLWAVLSDGIRTYCEEILRGSTDSFTYREVYRWILRDEPDAITSFASLCELFGIDARSLRRALMRFRQHPRADILEGLTVRVA